MWTVLDGHSLAALYAILFLGPFAAAYMVNRLKALFRYQGWW
jgi:hypothetical protein